MLPLVEELILHWDLLDFKLKKGIYTWINNRAGAEHISAHLDRFLAHSSLLLGKRLISSKVLPKLTSDHKPILLHLEEEENLGPIPFRFNSLWQYRARLSRNNISEITCSDGTMLKKQEQLKKAEKDHFQNVYKEEGNGSEEVTYEFLSHIPSFVSKEDNTSLMKPFSE
eukprot:PITA_28020